MSDARRQELERRAASGDPEARRALFLELARAGDPDFEAAAELRQRLRKAFYEVMDAGDPPMTQPLARVAPLSFGTLIQLLPEVLASEQRERVDYHFTEVARGPARFAHQDPPRCGALVLRVEDRLWVGLGVSEKERTLLPSHLWRGLSPWPSGKRSSVLRRLEDWIEAGDQGSRPECRRQRLIATTTGAVRALCQLEDYARSPGSGVWWQCLRRPSGRAARFPAHSQESRYPVWSQLEQLCAGWDPDELRGVLEDHFARSRPAELYPKEAEAPVALLQDWRREPGGGSSGEGP